MSSPEPPCVCRTIVFKTFELPDPGPARTGPFEPGEFLALIEEQIEKLRANHLRGMPPFCELCYGYGRTPCHWRPCPDCGGVGLGRVPE